MAIEKEEWKLDTLCDLYEIMSTTQVYVYVNTRRKADFIADQLTKRDLTVSTLHADLDRRERERVMLEVRSGCARVLVTTDSFARGIGVQQVSLVIHYDLPSSTESYVHRMGRCGRFGRSGVVISFITLAK